MIYQHVRPKNLNEIVGNDTTVGAIEAMLRQRDRPHTIFIKGPTGCGKTTIARILATKFGCDPCNILEYNAANTRGIDTIREIADSAHLLGLGGGIKTYIIDECHQLTKDSQEAVLKIFEDPIEHCYFILCTTEPNNLIKTVRNRCTEYEVGLLSQNEIKNLLNRTCETEKLKVDKDLIEAIAITCEGIPRRAIVSLEQIVGIENISEALELLVKGTEQDVTVIELFRMLIPLPEIRQKNWQRTLRIFDAIKAEPETVRKSILTFLFNKLIKCEDAEQAKNLANMINIFSTNVYYGGRSQLGALIIKACLG